jgi:hypothetical protein
VQVDRDGVREKTLFESGNRYMPGEAAAAMAYVEDNAALAPLGHSGVEVAGFVEFMTQPGNVLERNRITKVTATDRLPHKSSSPEA